ncbi:NYN domain-containing protein [Lujinxingia vulgaris]|uniref:NYN domain-containing protein n=1 Tax=Lujinxingia vulgaris TaxID=2600176 RepID=A0A5C6XGJ0_9DELT|nr:NYN domain-containing protein [Lujinxingia vulgaris]TXD42792.1 NYN domain-containing protein [Lujinxingia vulgaris]
MDAPNIAIFADFENVVIGAKDAKYDDFDIHLVLQRLLDKGNIVVKKAYADWDRYKSSKKPMHESAFELIEIPHVSYSGKNSADIRMVVDALDLCYTKAHVDLFVIISGDSDFSPLVSKLRENNKKVIGLGVKNSSSDLLIENCDEYIFYDDLVRDKRKSKKAEKSKSRDRSSAKSRSTSSSASSSSNGATESTPKSAPAPQHTKADEVGSKEEALDLVLDTTESLFRERDENVWGSMVKQTIKRKKPHFSETFYGYRNFSDLLEDAEKRGLLELKKDEKSGGYIILGFGPQA